MTPTQARARIDRFGGKLNAFAQVFEPAAGDGPTLAINDLIDFAGVASVGGGRSPLDRAPARHAAGVERLLDAGLCDVALGTETGGSVCIPAMACWVVGLKLGEGPGLAARRPRPGAESRYAWNPGAQRR